ncbi:MAG: peptidylprolyl isomerase, partial [Bacteroidota bacterium]
KLPLFELPKDLETINVLGASIAKFKGETYNTILPTFNHPINWSLVSSVGDTTAAEIITSKGVINIQFFPHDAPGSISNFVDLSLGGFYDNKVFHRVVPNFVIQGGCPDGDGYGNLDYTIRSELNPLYYEDEGYVGMARSDYNTEGTQWFITHSPTPHLNGKYSIFGKVTEGMDVVHQIEEGDVIRKINMVNL